MTPLHWAVEQQHNQAMLVLLEHGADPNAVSKFNKTPIILALEHERLDLVEVLQQEREVQQNQLQSNEIEAATQSLMQLEAERQKEEQERAQLEELQEKQRLAQCNVNH